MQLITHQFHINQLPDSPLKTHIQKRYDSLTFETDIPPNIILVESTDDLTGPDYAFVGNRGLLSDVYEQAEPGDPAFVRPYQEVSHLPDLGIYELLFLQHGEDGYWIVIPEAIVEAHPDLLWVLTSNSVGGLSELQLY